MAQQLEPIAADAFLRSLFGQTGSSVAEGLLQQLGITDGIGNVAIGQNEAGVDTLARGVTPEAIAALLAQGGGQSLVNDLGGLNRQAQILRDGQVVASQNYQADPESMMARLGPLAALLPIAAGAGLSALGVGGAAGGAGAAGAGTITGGSGLMAGGGAGLGGTGAGLSVGAGGGGIGAGIGSSIGSGLGAAGTAAGTAAGAGSMGIFDSILGSIGSGFGSQLAGGLLGAVAGGRDDTQTQTSGPPAWAMPYINQALGAAQQQFQTPYQAYTGDRVAGQSAGGLSGYEQQAFGAVQNWANGSGQLNQANGIYSQLAGGNNPFQVNGVAYATPNTIDGSAGQTSNSYIGQTTGPAAGAQAAQVGQNALLGMNNPFLQGAIDYAQGDVTRNYSNTIAPQQAAAAVASGSFGNTGLQQMQLEQQRNLAQELGRVTSDMRMQDYNLQAQLGESDLNRQQALNIYNAGLAQANNQFNAGLSQADLARNAQLQQQLGMFNAGNALQASQFNANTLNNASQFNANTSNNLAQFNANMGAGLMQTGLQGLMGVDSRLGQGAAALMNLGQINRGIEQQGLDAAYQDWLRQQQYPQQQLTDYTNLINALSGRATQAQTTSSGNPLLGALGGMQMAGALFGNTNSNPLSAYSTSGIGAWAPANYSLV